jgi:hypothetical protein
VGRAENGTIVFRAFHEPPFARLSRSYAVQPHSLKEFRFGLLHPSRRIGVVDGCRDPLQRVYAQSVAQVLCGFVQQR